MIDKSDEQFNQSLDDEMKKSGQRPVSQATRMEYMGDAPNINVNFK
jgi:hypothetical protein